MSGPDDEEDDLELFRDPEEDEEAPPARVPDTTPPPGFKPRPRPLRILTVSGAKGGVGKTLLASNLALYLATIGRKVVVVDADAEGANVHTFLGIARPGALRTYVPPAHSFPTFLEPPPVSPFALRRRSLEPPPLVEAPPKDPDLIETPIPGLSLLHAGLDEPPPGKNRRTRCAELLGRLRDLDAEYVMVDLGAGTDRARIDFFLQSDLSIFVTLPEPTAIENTYRFIRLAFARHLRWQAPDTASRRRLVDLMRELDHAPAPLDLLRALDKDGDPLAGFVRETLDDFRFRVVLNQTRVRADLELGDRIRSATRRRLAVQIDYLGYVDFDDTVWSCVRMLRPLLVESPGTKASKAIEKIARRVLAVDSGKAGAEPLRTVPPESHHDLLEIDRGANDEEIRRAYKRARDVYASDSLCCYGLFDADGLEALRARLDEAYDVLLDPARRRPYELSVFPGEPAPDAAAPPPGARNEPAPPAPVITPDTEFTGPLMKAVRESQRLDLREISRKTKIGLGYLRALEADEFASLPAAVYVRGFVTEVAKLLRLDPDQVSRTYVRRFKRFLEEQGKL